MVATTTQLPAVVTILDLQSAALPLDSTMVFEAVQSSNGTMISVQVPLTAIMTTVQGALPTGGGTGQILNKTNANNYSTQWSSITDFVAVGTGLVTSGAATSIVVSLATQVGLSVLGVAGTGTLAPAVIVGTAGQVLRVNDAGTSLAFGAINLASSAAVTGVVPYANGGSNASTAWTQGSVLFAGTSTLAQDNTNFFWDDANNRLGIGTPVPRAKLSVSANATTPVPQVGTIIQLVSQDGSAAVFQLESYNSGGPTPQFWGRSAQGTAGGPSPVLSGNRTFQLVGQGYDGNPNWGGGLAVINFIAAENFTAGHNGQLMQFFTVPTSSTTSTEAMRIQASGGVSIGTTSDPAIGSLVTTGKHTILSGTALSSTATSVLVFGSIASFGIYIGTGVPAVNAGTGSLFLRNDGATATSRMYVNTNGTGTWTSVNTVA